MFACLNNPRPRTSNDIRFLIYYVYRTLQAQNFVDYNNYRMTCIKGVFKAGVKTLPFLCSKINALKQKRTHCS